MEGGEGGFPEEKWPFASRLSGAIHHVDRLDIFLPPLPPHLHLHGHVFSREVNAAECRCPREPPRARETPTASHILRMKTFTTILARATPPTPSFPSRGQRPMMSLLLRVSPPFLSSLFLPYPSLTLFEGILSSFLLFFFFRFRTREWVEVCSLSSERGRKEFLISFGTDRNELLFRCAYSGRIYHSFVSFGFF